MESSFIQRYQYVYQDFSIECGVAFHRYENELDLINRLLMKIT